jgi:quercetin dioxygenase-like cupin family protein
MKPTIPQRPIDMNLQIVQTAHAQAFAALTSGVVQRELGLDSASNGMFTARRVKARGQWSVDQIAGEQGSWFTLILVLEGSLTLKQGDTTVTLQKQDAASQVSLSPASVVDASPELEFFELQARDDPRVRALIPERPGQMVDRDAPERHVVGTGPRDFFDYRNLGIAKLTNRQLELEVIRAQRARQGGTGWHSHTMGQLSYGLSGWASIGIEGVAQPVIQEPGDSMCLPPECVHNADSFSDDYWALQLQIPADYQTRPRDTPSSASH